jgi:hypothetical protein
MNRIKELLQAQGKQIADSAIEAKLAEYGLNADKVSEADAKTIAEELAPLAQTISGLAVSNGNPAPATASKGGKPAKKGRTKKLKNEVDESAFNESITHLAHVAKAEIDVVTHELQAGADAWKEQTKQDWKEIILNTPVEAMNEMLDEVREEAPDIAGFRKTTQSAVRTVFPLRTAS